MGSTLRQLWPARALTLIFAAGMALFLFWNRHTGLGFFDASELSIHIKSGGIAHAPGYPLYILLGRLVCTLTADPFLAQHLISLASLAFAGFALYRSLRREAEGEMNEPAALLTVMLLWSSFYLKQYTVHPEVFLLNVALFAALGWALAVWYRSGAPSHLIWVFFVYGLGLAHHHTLAFTLPATATLITWRFRAIPRGESLLFAVLGLAVGALPLLYLFFAIRPPDTFATYYFVESFRDFLFVLLREGYGTFSLSVHENTAGPWDVFTLMTQGLIKNFNFIGGLVLVPFVAWLVRRKPWGARAKEHPLLVYAALTLVVFALVFIPRGNLSLATATYKNALLRFVTVPGFLLLYPAFYGFRHLLSAWPRPRHGLKLAGCFALIASSNWFGLEELRLGDHDLLEQHVRRGFNTIFADPAPEPVWPEAGLHKCAVFAIADSLIFGLRYANRFYGDRRCFIFMPGSFSGQFRSRPEEELQAAMFGASYPQLLAAHQHEPQVLMQLLFTRLKESGYRLFVFYQPDFAFLSGAGFAYAPVGNILELVAPAELVSPDSMLARHQRYLDDLALYLAQRNHGMPAAIIDDVAALALFQNMAEYARFNAILLPTEPALVEKHARVQHQIDQLRR